MLVRRLVVASKFLWAQTFEDTSLESGPTAEASSQNATRALQEVGHI